MTLHKILKSLDEPVRPEVTKQIITYMKSMPGGKEELIGQCITHLETTQTLGAMLAVVHALNDGEFLLRCHTDVNENELVQELEEMFRDKEEEGEKTTHQSSPYDQRMHEVGHHGDDDDNVPRGRREEEESSKSPGEVL